MINAELAAEAPYLRNQLSVQSKNAEKAFERAFDLQQAGADAARVDAALAEVNRLQGVISELQERLGGNALVH